MSSTRKNTSIDYSSKHYPLSLSKISSHVIHRMGYENLLDLHNLLITSMFAKSTGNKRPYQEDHVPSFAPRASVTPYHPPMKCESDTEAAPTYSQADFPDIKFWTKEEFMEFEAKRKIHPTPWINLVPMEGQDAHRAKTLLRCLSNSWMEEWSAVCMLGTSDILQGPSGRTYM